MDSQYRLLRRSDWWCECSDVYVFGDRVAGRIVLTSSRRFLLRQSVLSESDGWALWRVTGALLVPFVTMVDAFS